MAGSVNKVIIVGNLGKDPEIRTLNSGYRVANLRIDSAPRLQVNSNSPYDSASTASTTPCSTSPIHGHVSDGTNTPTIRVRPRAKPTAPELGT